MSGKLLKLLRVAAIGLLIVGGAGVWYYGYRWDSYRHTLPRIPEPTTRRIYPMNLRGLTVYATRAERDRLHVINVLSEFFVAAGVIGGILTDSDFRRKMGWRRFHHPQSPP